MIIYLFKKNVRIKLLKHSTNLLANNGMQSDKLLRWRLQFVADAKR